MKKTKRRALYIVAALLGALFVLSCLVGFAACGGGSKESDGDTPTVSSVSVNPTTLSIEEGASGSITATVAMSSGSYGGSYTWKSSDENIATVSGGATATVTAIKAGSTNVTVTVGEGSDAKSATCAVTVTDAAPYATGIELNETSMSVAVGDANTLKAKVTMSDNGTYSGSYTWKSSDESVATVSDTGSEATVTALKAGATTITVSDGGTKSASCAVTVSERLAVPDATSDADALKYNDTEYFEGYDYTVSDTTITNEEDEEEAAYLITGTASAMTESLAAWFNGGDTGAAKAGDSYITLKIFVGIGNTISYTSYGESEKSYTNEDGAGVFDGDYLFVVQRLTGVQNDGTQVTSLDGVSYTIKDGSGNVREEVSIIFDITTVAWDGVSVNYSWDTTTEISQVEEYTIYSAEELAGLAHLVNDDSDWDPSQEHHNSDSWVDITRKWTIKLGADIDLGDKAWEPIGGALLYTNASGTNYNSQFRGTFDGQGHTIYNLNVSKTTCEDGYDGTGLFGFVGGGAVENVTIENVKSSGLELVGGLIGVSYEHNSYDTDGFVNVDNCHLTGHIEITGHHQVGGIVGSATASEYTNCTVEGDDTSFIQSTYDAGEKDTRAENYDGDAVGGIAGYLTRGDNNFAPTSGDDNRTEESIAECQTDANELTGCAVSNINISGCRKVGGLVGHTSGSVNYANCSVEDCTIALVYNSAYSDKIDNNSPRLFVGALVGEFEWVQTVTSDCTVSNVAVIYIAEDGITGNYTPTAGETNPYAGLFGGSRNQAGYDSNDNTPYSQVVYAELTDNPGTNATVIVTDLSLTKDTSYTA